MVDSVLAQDSADQSPATATAHIYPFVKVNNLRLSEDVLYILYMMGLLELSDDDIHSKSIIDTAKIEN